MSDAPSRIGGMVADLLGDLEERYGEGAVVLDALIAVEVLPDDEDLGSIIEHRCTSRRVTVAVGLAKLMGASLMEPYGRGDGDDEDASDGEE